MRVYVMLAGIFVFSVLVGMSPALVRSVARRHRMRDRKRRLLALIDEHQAKREATN